MLFKSGSRTRRRVTFFCAASHKDVANAENAGAFFGQKQVTKEKAARLPLMSCAPRTCAQWGICRGDGKRGFLPLCRRAASLPRPFGLFPTNAAVLDAANGRNARYCVTSVIKRNKKHVFYSKGECFSRFCGRKVLIMESKTCFGLQKLTAIFPQTPQSAPKFPAHPNHKY